MGIDNNILFHQEEVVGKLDVNFCPPANLANKSSTLGIGYRSSLDT